MHSLSAKFSMLVKRKKYFVLPGGRYLWAPGFALNPYVAISSSSSPSDFQTSFLLIHLLIYSLTIFMQAGPVQLQAGLTGGLFMIYLVKQNVFRNTEYKSGAHNTNYKSHIRYTIYVTLQYSVLYQYIDEV